MTLKLKLRSIRSVQEELPASSSSSLAYYPSALSSALNLPMMSHVPPGLPADLQRWMGAVVLDVLSSIHLREGQLEYALRCLNEGMSLRKVGVPSRRTIRTVEARRIGRVGASVQLEALFWK